jgi:sulfotransferase family protein
MRLPSRLRRARGDRDRRAPARAPAPFIVGVSRSGTTSLRRALDAHPELAIPPETHFVPELIETCQTSRAGPDEVVGLLAGEPHWPLFGVDAGAVRALLPASGRVKPRAALRAFYGAYADSRHRSRWGDETPGYLHWMRLIAAALPEARFVHVIRDVRDVALSMIEAGQIRPDAVDSAARQWAAQVGRARVDAARVDHCLEIRYEDLALEPEPTLRRVAEFLELVWDPAVVEAGPARRDASSSAPSRTAPGTRPVLAEPPERWRSEMGPEDRRACEAAAGDLLAQLGYEIGAGPGLDGILQAGGAHPTRDG